MDEFIKAAGRFTWAMSLFGVQQLINTFARTRSNEQQQSAQSYAFEAIARTAEEQLGESTGAAFRAGDMIQRLMIDMMFNLLTPQALTSSGVMRAALDVMQQSAIALRLVSPQQENRLAWQEFENKLEAFSLFERVDEIFGLDSEQTINLAELVGRATRLGPYQVVWATEGLGHYYAEVVWAQSGEAVNLLTGAEAQELPHRSLVALHSGMGLAFANRVLASVNSSNAGREVERALSRFIKLCRENSRAGYTEAALEGLGLVARNLYPQLLNAIDQHLAEIEEALPSYFWHGVGRAIYFAPTNFLSRATFSGQAIEMTQQEPPHELGRSNALAGLAWAMTLVNIRHPEIIEAFLRRHSARVCETDAFSNGLSSALAVWRDSTKDAPYLSEFCEHKPASDEPRFSELWEKLVKRPALDSLNRIYPILKQHESLGELFRYQPLNKLVERLERDEEMCPAQEALNGAMT